LIDEKTEIIGCIAIISYSFRILGYRFGSFACDSVFGTNETGIILNKMLSLQNKSEECQSIQIFVKTSK